MQLNIKSKKLRYFYLALCNNMRIWWWMWIWRFLYQVFIWEKNVHRQTVGVASREIKFIFCDIDVQFKTVLWIISNDTYS